MVMKFSKKIISVALAAVMVVTLFSGCSSQGGKSSSATTSSGKAPVEIEYWYGLGGKLGDTMQKLVNDFNASQTTYHVKGVAQADYDTTYKAVQAAIASKTPPACFLTTADTVHTLGNKDVLQDIEPYIAKDSDFKPNDFLQSLMSSVKIGKKQYAIPAYGSTQVLYYRKDLFEQAGISPDVLNDWDSLEKAAAQLTKKTGGTVSIYGWEPMSGSGNMIDAALSAGGSILSANGKTVTIDTKPWIDSWEFFRHNIFDTKTMAIHTGGQGWQYWYDTIDDVLGGKAAGYTGSSGDQGDLDFSKVAAHEQPGWNGKPGKPVASGNFIAIPAAASAAQKQAAFAWIKYFTSAKVTAEWSMSTGYIPVRLSAEQSPDFKAYLEKNPQAKVPIEQAAHASPAFIDPTGGKIDDIIEKASEGVEIENKPVADVLKQAQSDAQKALDAVVK
jgi:multiple sugar transport system substrate-binding protein